MEAVAVSTESLWQATRTFFPLFLAQLAEITALRVAVVGASDGKFVLPLARQGYQVHAIERNRAAIDGGPVLLPGRRPDHMPGLRSRLRTEGLEHLVQIDARDVLDPTDARPSDAVWTSCSWHYSVNHQRPLADFIDRLKSLCLPGGILGAEYMMPVDPQHATIEHYLDEGQVLKYLDGWPVLWEAYTPRFVEDPHVEQPDPHEHRMGFVVCRRPG
jgi:SAM-dependent methyltransferase